MVNLNLMAQNKTTLILNNLVVLNYPLKTSAQVQSNQMDDGVLEIKVSLPFLSLLQKVDLVGVSRPTPAILSVQRSTINQESVFTDLIDFKKQKINWRFKSRMRSNSNEFIDGFPLNSPTQAKAKTSEKRADKESFECSSSLELQDEDDWELEEVKGTLVCAVSQMFKVLIAPTEDVTDLVLQVSVWPTIRMPTGGATIPLINTSFLLATRGHVEESYEIDFLVAQSLVNARKFIQAAEKFRSIEARLLKSGDRDDLYRCMLLEIIIGESMSQHSQVSEKIYAFRRATLIKTWFMQNSDDVEPLVQALQQGQKIHVKQEEAQEHLFCIKSKLVQILLANVQSHIEVVRMAVLKTLEYLLDTLNCSLENQIVDILKVICACYPNKEPTANQAEQYHGFFQHSFSQQNATAFSWHAVHREQDCQVQDVKSLTHSLVQSALNCHNHILENIGLLMGSASHHLLQSLFRQVILPEATNPKLPLELKIYLLNYTEQIVQNCKGDISFNGQFLTELLDTITQQQQQQQLNKKKSMRLNSAATTSQTNLQQVSLSVLEQMKQHYFPSLFVNYTQGQQTSMKTFEWLLQTLQEQADKLVASGGKILQQTDSWRNSRKLNILLSITESLVASLVQEDPQQKGTLQHVYWREQNLPQPSDLSKQSNESFFSDPSRQQQMSMNLRYLQMLLPLTQPLVTLFTFAVQSQERLPLFKQVWNLLSLVLQKLPPKLTKRPQLTLQALVEPQLSRLNQYMLTSSPTQKMLEFLQIVVTTIRPFLSLEQSLLVTLLGTIPHNLHDEIFQVSGSLLDIYYGQLGQKEISLLVEVLVHKYTMRSKEHKMLVDKVIQRVLLSQENQQIFDTFLKETLTHNLYTETQDQEAVFFEKLSMLYELVCNLHPSHVWHFRRLLDQALDPLTQIFSISPRSKQSVLKLLLKLTEFYQKVCQPFNHYEYPLVVPVQHQLPEQRVFVPARGQMVYSEPSVELFSIGHHDEDYQRVEMTQEAAAYLEMEPRIEAPIPQSRTRPHYQSQHVDYRAGQMLVGANQGDEGDERTELYESPRILHGVIYDQVGLLDRDRLLLVKIHASLIKVECDQQAQQQDATVKLCVLNLMQNMFANLLPTPTLKNMVIQDLIGQERVNLVQPIRMQQVPQAGIPTDFQGIPEPSSPGPDESDQPQELIPELSEIVLQKANSQQEPSFPPEFECSNPKYLCARVLAFLKVSKYLEEIITSTAWANLKSLAISVLNLGVIVPNVNILPPKLQRHLKNALQPLLIKLIQNGKDSESRAAALNTLAAICNLQLKQRRNYFSDDSSKPMQRLPFEPQALDECLPADIQITQHISLFRVNSQFISVAIWQQVFDLQEDASWVVREASAALIRLCAPADSVQHFVRIKKEQYKLKVNELLSQHSQQYMQSQSQQETRHTSQEMASTMHSGFQEAVDDEEDESSSDSQESFKQAAFTEDEARLVLHLFTLQCQPLLNLQTDRPECPQPAPKLLKQHLPPTKDLYEDGFLTFQNGAFKLVSNSDEEDASSAEMLCDSSEDEVYIFRRDSSRRLRDGDPAGAQTQSQQQVMQQENEDLGIIDLDDSELFGQDDDFEELDDDKLPVLKNTYSKKNRPNNSKSVAVGSRSQGGALKTIGLRGLLAGEEKQEMVAEIEEQDPQSKRQQQLKLVAAALTVDRFEELKSDFETKSFFQKSQKLEQELEYELSVRGGLSVASLPIPRPREIQSAGGKRNQNQFSMVSQSDTLFLPTDLKNLDIEEVQIYVKRKQRPVSGRGSQLSRDERLLREQLSDLSAHKTNKLIQTDTPMSQKQKEERKGSDEVEGSKDEKTQQFSTKLVKKKEKTDRNFVKVLSRDVRPETVTAKKDRIVTKQTAKKPQFGTTKFKGLKNDPAVEGQQEVMLFKKNHSIGVLKEPQVLERNASKEQDKVIITDIL